jgi:hypothetical protein
MDDLAARIETRIRAMFPPPPEDRLTLTPAQAAVVMEQLDGDGDGTGSGVLKRIHAGHLPTGPVVLKRGGRYRIRIDGFARWLAGAFEEDTTPRPRRPRAVPVVARADLHAPRRPLPSSMMAPMLSAADIKRMGLRVSQRGRRFMEGNRAQGTPALEIPLVPIAPTVPLGFVLAPDDLSIPIPADAHVLVARIQSVIDRPTSHSRIEHANAFLHAVAAALRERKVAFDKATLWAAAHLDRSPRLKRRM